MREMGKNHIPFLRPRKVGSAKSWVPKLVNKVHWVQKKKDFYSKMTLDHIECKTCF